MQQHIRPYGTKHSPSNLNQMVALRARACKAQQKRSRESRKLTRVEEGTSSSKANRTETLRIDVILSVSVGRRNHRGMQQRVRAYGTN